ncbi:alpha/beta hydrolase [Streptomyces sp. NPDC051921]|uniref:alpha/beta hydrolase n=1 Tax=Streptomyces sp. NPDC051921 TaxID=3155806 RepID=UPI003419A439
MAPLARGDRRAPAPVRPRRRRRTGRLRRTLLAALVTAAVAVPVAGAARPAEVPAPAPPGIGRLTSAEPTALAGELAARYAANREALRAAEGTADSHGARRRAASLREMAAPERQFLSFDGRDGGRSAEVVGDLARAERIAVLVPGADTGLDSYGRLRAGAVALQKALQQGAYARTAVIAWLGYRTPGTGSAASLTPGRAEQAAPALRSLVQELSAVRPGARITLLGHSYGSVVCALAATRTPVAAVVLYGSPGTGFDTAADLRTTASVWAGRATGDWVAEVPHVRVPLPGGTELGFGTDPVDPRFGARRFAAGAGGHSDYLVPGSPSLRNLARIVDGQEPDRA